MALHALLHGIEYHTTYPTRASTVLFILTSLALVPLSMGLGCDSDPDLAGANSLKELYEVMLDDFKSSLEGNGPEAPYVYTLCPGQIYDVADEGYWIEPLLDGTVVKCGSDGKSKNGCIVKGGDLQVVLIESTEEEYVRSTTTFQGITFSGSSDISVASYDRAGTSAEFVDCHWKDAMGGFVMQIAFSERQDSSENNANRRRKLEFGQGRHLQDDKSGMSILLKDCSISTTSSIFGLANVDGSLSLDSVVIENNPYVEEFSIFAIWNEATAFIKNSRFIKSNYLVNVANFRGDLFLDASEFNSNKGQASVGIVGGTTSVDGCKFINNDHPTTGNIDATEGAFVDVSYCEFTDTQHSQAEIIVIGGSDLFLQDSCFFSGTYALSPVFVGGDSMLGDSFNNYAESLSTSLGQECVNPAGVFVQEPGGNYTNCFDKKETTKCAGTCQGDFDANVCGFDRTTMAPTQVPTSAPTEKITLSSVPSASRLPRKAGIIHWLLLPVVVCSEARWWGK